MRYRAGLRPYAPGAGRAPVMAGSSGPLTLIPLGRASLLFGCMRARLPGCLCAIRTRVAPIAAVGCPDFENELTELRQRYSGEYVPTCHGSRGSRVSTASLNMAGVLEQTRSGALFLPNRAYNDLVAGWPAGHAEVAAGRQAMRR